MPQLEGNSSSLLLALPGSSFTSIVVFLSLRSMHHVRPLAATSRALSARLFDEDTARALVFEGFSSNRNTPHRHWPTHIRSWWRLHSILEEWQVRQGFYGCLDGYPWGGLVLLRFRDGHFVGEVLKGGLANETRTEILRVTFEEDKDKVELPFVDDPSQDIMLVSSPFFAPPSSLPLDHHTWTPKAAERLFLERGVTVVRAKNVPSGSPGSLQQNARSPLTVVRRFFRRSVGLESNGTAASGEEHVDAMNGVEARASMLHRAPQAEPSSFSSVRDLWSPEFGTAESAASQRDGHDGDEDDPEGNAGDAADHDLVHQRRVRSMFGSLFRHHGGVLRLWFAFDPAAPFKAAAVRPHMHSAVAGVANEGSGVTIWDSGAPPIRPGLYVGSYGNSSLYGQHRHEALLVEYREYSFEHAGLADVATSDAAAADQRRLSHFLATNKSTLERLENEVFDRRPDRSAISHCASEILRGGVTKAVFCFGRKVTGDIHVPMGAITWIALVHPPLPEEQRIRGRMPVRDNTDRLLHSVRQRWTGWGTLAYPGFHNPSWSMGELVQLEDEKVPPSRGGRDYNHRFAFAWGHSQKATILHWVEAQDDVQVGEVPLVVANAD